MWCTARAHITQFQTYGGNLKWHCRRSRAERKLTRWIYAGESSTRESPSTTDIAKNLNVAVSTAYRTYRIFERTGKVDPLDRSSGREELRKLDRSSELYVVGFILDNPSIYLHEVCQEVKECFDLMITPLTICKLLKRYGITRKKIRQVARQRCNALRGAFIAQTFLFKREMFVWVDETDKRDQLRKYGYALRGTTHVYHRFSHEEIESMPSQL